MIWYPTILFLVFYSAFAGLGVLFSKEITRVRSGKTDMNNRGVSIIIRMEHYVRVFGSWLKSVAHVSLFKGATMVHKVASNLATKTYRNASKSREGAQVSTLLRSLKDTDSRGVIR
ncbi:MAG: hypothetical protein Q8Q18_03705 [bacterium]|nr:hypothetical protein [bacterium]